MEDFWQVMAQESVESFNFKLTFVSNSLFWNVNSQSNMESILLLLKLQPIESTGFTNSSKPTLICSKLQTRVWWLSSQSWRSKRGFLSKGQFIFLKLMISYWSDRDSLIETPKTHTCDVKPYLFSPLLKIILIWCFDAPNFLLGTSRLIKLIVQYLNPGQTVCLVNDKTTIRDPPLGTEFEYAHSSIF